MNEQLGVCLAASQRQPTTHGPIENCVIPFAPYGLLISMLVLHLPSITCENVIVASAASGSLLHGDHLNCQAIIPAILLLLCDSP